MNEENTLKLSQNVVKTFAWWKVDKEKNEPKVQFLSHKNRDGYHIFYGICLLENFPIQKGVTQFLDWQKFKTVKSHIGICYMLKFLCSVENIFSKGKYSLQ